MHYFLAFKNVKEKQHYNSALLFGGHAVCLSVIFLNVISALS